MSLEPFDSSQYSAEYIEHLAKPRLALTRLRVLSAASVISSCLFFLCIAFPLIIALFTEGFDPIGNQATFFAIFSVIGAAVGGPFFGFSTFIFGVIGLFVGFKKYEFEKSPAWKVPKTSIIVSLIVGALGILAGVAFLLVVPF